MNRNTIGSEAHYTQLSFKPTAGGIVEESILLNHDSYAPAYTDRKTYKVAVDKFVLNNVKTPLFKVDGKQSFIFKIDKKENTEEGVSLELYEYVKAFLDIYGYGYSYYDLFVAIRNAFNNAMDELLLTENDCKMVLGEDNNISIISTQAFRDDYNVVFSRDYMFMFNYTYEGLSNSDLNTFFNVVLDKDEVRNSNAFVEWNPIRRIVIQTTLGITPEKQNGNNIENDLVDYYVPKLSDTVGNTFIYESNNNYKFHDVMGESNRYSLRFVYEDIDGFRTPIKALNSKSYALCKLFFTEKGEIQLSPPV